MFRWTHSLSAKLNLLLFAAMLLIFALLGYLNIRLHRQHLEQAVLLSAERVSDVIRRSTTDYMLRNDRAGLYNAIRTFADEPGISRIRIFDKEGRITYTTDAAELDHVVDKSAEACYACHNQSEPLAKSEPPRPLSHLPQRSRLTRSRHHYSHRKSAGLLQCGLPCTSRRSADSGRSRHQPVTGEN